MIVKGLVIKEYVVGEGDKYITLFTHELGKIDVFVQRYTKNYSAGTGLFVYGTFQIGVSKGTYKLQSVDIINMFHKLREDILMLSYASYITEFLLEVAHEGEKELLRLSLYTLHELTLNKLSYKLIKAVFELRAMRCIGLMPSVTHCTQCGEQASEQDYYLFSIEEGGYICNSCNVPKAIKIQADTMYAMNFILSTPYKQLFKFSASNKLVLELVKLVDKYILYYIEKTFKTTNFIRNLDGLM
ncbi:MAG: DNA repair protein RecO [Epulopiscium sp. Nele67-Bin004]|nr:MAG: DNA repair protein RecO [Epulopiscium sp. Nele67-Bin004]